MNITKYNLEICHSCYRLKGTVEEEFNGIVPVFCMCDVSAQRHSNHNPRMQGGVITNGSVLLRFMPCSDYRRSDGEIWHVSHFAGFGWGRGKPGHYNTLFQFIKEHNEVSVPGPESDFIHFLDFNNGWKFGSSCPVSMYYQVQGAGIHILKICNYQYDLRRVDIGTTPCDNEFLKSTLIQSVVDFNSFNNNPVWVKSNLISREEFPNIIRYAGETTDNLDKRSLGSKQNIINICGRNDLHPLPARADSEHWLADCPSGGWHKFRISPASEQWNCDHCGKSGGKYDLFCWIKSWQQKQINKP